MTKPGALTLTLTASGTAMASVCVVGLLQIERLAGGVWSAVAIAGAGALCMLIAVALGRLTTVLPTGAGLLAYFSRGLNRRAATLLMTAYLTVMLLLVGVETLIVGVLLEELTGLPVLAGALGFLGVTWLVCRRGLQVGYRTESIATIALFVCLVALAVAAVVSGAQRGDLGARLVPAAPPAADLVAAIGQAIFLMMGFELVTSHAEVAAPGAVRRSLVASIPVLVVFYVVVALGFSSLDAVPIDGDGLIVPQIALAAHAGSSWVTAGVVVVCLLASFTSFNGALLGVSLFTRALARQGVLPQALSKVDPKTLVARPALNALFAVTAAFTLATYLLSLYEAAILGAAVVAACVYAAVLWTREQPPFREPTRARARAWIALAVAAGFAALAVGVLADAGRVRFSLTILLLAILAVAIVAASRIRVTAPQPRQG